MQDYVDLGIFALGLFIGIVGTVTALLECVTVKDVDPELFKETLGEIEVEEGGTDA